MKLKTQFSIFLVNKPGVLAFIIGALADAKVNILALTLMDSGEQGVLRLVCEDDDAARSVLQEAHDRWTETDVMLLDVEDRPGAFAELARLFADAHINISYSYCTGNASGGATAAVFKVADVKKAERALAGGQ